MMYYILGVSSYHQCLSYEYERSRIRYELSQNMNNIIVDLKEKNPRLKNSELTSLYKTDSLNYLNDPFLEDGKYFIAHFEKVISKHASLLNLKYILNFEPALYPVLSNLSTKKQLVFFLYDLIEVWDYKQVLQINLRKKGTYVELMVTGKNLEWLDRLERKPETQLFTHTEKAIKSISFRLPFS